MKTHDFQNGEGTMSSKKWSMMLAILVVSSMLLTACPAPQPQIQEKVVEKVVTQVVEKEKVVEKPVEKVVEVVVTAEPTPVPAEPGLPVISPTFKNPDTYVVVDGAGEQETLDPAWTYETRGGAIESNLYEGLTWFNREKYDEFIPALATDWKMSDDGKSWVFNVRKGVSFHEGGTLEPHDVAYTLHRSMLQGRIDGFQWILYESFFGGNLAMASSKDFAAAFTGKDAFENLAPEDLAKVCEAVKATVVADDAAGTVTFNLKQPVPWFLTLTSTQFMGGIVDKEWMIENGDWDDDCATWQTWADPSAEETILYDKGNGTGPYKLDHWTPGEETVIVAFENYWRTEPMWEGGPSGPARIKQVVLKNVPEWGTRLAMLEAGDADWIYADESYRPQLDQYTKTRCDDAGQCTEINPNGYILAYRGLPSPQLTPAQLNWRINTEGGNPFVGSGQLDGNGVPAEFFNDIHIRKAFSYCFNYDALIDDALVGEGVQAQGPIIAGMLGYRDGEKPLYNYDPDKCVEEFKLADADKDGILAGEDPDDVWERGFYMQVAYNQGNDTRRLSAEILKASVEAVNPSFNVQVLAMPWPVLLSQRRAGKLPVYIGGWIEDYHDPHNWVGPFLYSQGAYGRVINMTADLAQQFDELVLKGAAETDQEARRKIYQEIQLKAQEEAVVVWMYQNLDGMFFQQWIKGFYFNPAYQEPSYAWIYALSKEQ